jgi:hypothetical protein
LGLCVDLLQPVRRIIVDRLPAMICFLSYVRLGIGLGWPRKEKGERLAEKD